MTQQKILSREQTALVNELTQAYNIEPEEILFFSDDPKPFFTFEATCVLCNALSPIDQIDIEPIAPVGSDSVSLRCTLSFPNGRTRTAVGVANLAETIDGTKMSEQQTYLLASSRAIRNALRTAGIDLLKLHREGGGDFSGPARSKSNFVTLLSNAHALGQEAGLINGEDRSGWYRLLRNRYDVKNSNELTEDQLADFVAVLKTLVPQHRRTSIAA